MSQSGVPLLKSREEALAIHVSRTILHDIWMRFVKTTSCAQRQSSLPQYTRNHRPSPGPSWGTLQQRWQRNDPRNSNAESASNYPRPLSEGKRCHYRLINREVDETEKRPDYSEQLNNGLQMCPLIPSINQSELMSAFLTNIQSEWK